MKTIIFGSATLHTKQKTCRNSNQVLPTHARLLKTPELKPKAVDEREAPKMEQEKPNNPTSLLYRGHSRMSTYPRDSGRACNQAWPLCDRILNHVSCGWKEVRRRKTAHAWSHLSLWPTRRDRFESSWNGARGLISLSRDDMS